MTQLAHPAAPRSRMRLAAAAVAGIAVTVAVVAAIHGSGGTSSAGPVPARHLASVGGVTPATLRTLTTEAFGPATSVPRYAASDGLPRVRATTCRRHVCAVSFNSDYTPALHTMAQLTSQTGPLLAAAFRDPALRGLSVTVWGPSQSQGTIAENPLLRLDCTANGVAGIDLARAAADRIESACAFIPYVRVS